MTKFEFIKSAVDGVNMDSDLFYDLTSGGYIKPHELLTDKELAQKIVDAANLVSEFFEALNDEAEK